MKQVAALTFLMLILGAGPAVGAVKIELQKESAVAGDVVRLGDVALIEAGDLATALRTLIVCPAPAAGDTLTLTGDRLKRRVAAVLGETELTVVGADRCVITRSALPAAVAPLASEAAGAESPAATLEAAVRTFVLSRITRPADQVRLDFDSRDHDTLALSGERYLFKVISAANQMDAGNTNLRIEASERVRPDRVVRSLYVRLGVTVLENVVVTAHDLRAGDVLTAEDVRVERREFREPAKAPLFHDVADVVGATARNNTAVGQALRLEDLAKTLMVRRGDAVTVYVHGRGFTIKAPNQCRALESGEQGSSVAVQGVDGSGKFYATVTGPRTVELAMAGDQAATRTAAAPRDERKTR